MARRFFYAVILIVALALPVAAGIQKGSGGGTASEVSYDNSTSGLTATDVKAALDELEGEIDSLSAGGLSDLDDLPGDTVNDDLIDFVLLAGVQPLEATLTDIADGTITENLVNTANPWADNEVADTLTIGASSTVANGALDADLQAWAGVTSSANGRSLVSAADYAAMRALLDLEAGTDFNAYNATLAAVAGGTYTGDDSITTVGTIAAGTWNATALDADKLNISAANTTITERDETDYILLHDTSAGATVKMTVGNFVTGLGGGASSIVLDLADNGANESTGIGEIATSGDTNSIFTEPSADKLLINLANDWPKADQADVALTGDSATSFFSAGTIELARGGAGADLSAYTGLVGITGGAAVEVDTAAELETALAGANVIFSTEVDTVAKINALTTDADFYYGGGTDVAVADGGTGASNAAGAKTNLGFITDLVDDTTPQLGGNLDVNGKEIQSAGNVVIQLGDNAGSYKLSIQDSDGAEVWYLDSNGLPHSMALNNPYVFLDENDGTDLYLRVHDTTNDVFEINTNATAGNAATQWLRLQIAGDDAGDLSILGDMSIATGKTYQINGTQINIGNLAAGGNWTPTGTLNLDSATLQNIGHGTVVNGASYTTISNNAAHDTIDELFAAINSWAAGIGAGTLLALTDVGGSDVYTAGYILIGDGTNSYDPKAISGDISLGSDGAVLVLDLSDLTGDMAAANGNNALTISPDDEATDTLVLRARDVDGATWDDIITITSANAPTLAINADGGITSTSSWDLGSATFELPNGANPTLTAAGQASVDTSATTGGMFRFYTDAERALPAYQTKEWTIKGADANSDYALWKTPYAITIQKVSFIQVGGTNWVGQMQEADANGGSGADTQAADSTVSANTDVTSFSNASVDAGDYLNIKTTSVSGTNTYLTVTVLYTVDPVN